MPIFHPHKRVTFLSDVSTHLAVGNLLLVNREPSVHQQARRPVVHPRDSSSLSTREGRPEAPVPCPGAALPYIG